MNLLIEKYWKVIERWGPGQAKPGIGGERIMVEKQAGYKTELEQIETDTLTDYWAFVKC